ncbi:unnamed protein product [Moneuplotes crassus]|uniref:Origin recognition complex subunit 3 N-terminal domain-containing protein n=1 Tax=Euplotes crassus TaxID=5936 RepID=A0AAD1U2F2_EUPCR|nr:unnamed protein product [Moneuplotes crassus]
MNYLTLRQPTFVIHPSNLDSSDSSKYLIKYRNITRDKLMLHFNNQISKVQSAHYSHTFQKGLQFFRTVWDSPFHKVPVLFLESSQGGTDHSQGLKNMLACLRINRVVPILLDPVKCTSVEKMVNYVFTQICQIAHQEFNRVLKITRASSYENPTVRKIIKSNLRNLGDGNTTNKQDFDIPTIRYTSNGQYFEIPDSSQIPKGFELADLECLVLWKIKMLTPANLKMYPIVLVIKDLDQFPDDYMNLLIYNLHKCWKKHSIQIGLILGTKGYQFDENTCNISIKSWDLIIPSKLNFPHSRDIIVEVMQNLIKCPSHSFTFDREFAIRILSIAQVCGLTIEQFRKALKFAVCKFVLKDPYFFLTIAEPMTCLEVKDKKQYKLKISQVIRNISLKSPIKAVGCSKPPSQLRKRLLKKMIKKYKEASKLEHPNPSKSSQNIMCDTLCSSQSEHCNDSEFKGKGKTNWSQIWPLLGPRGRFSSS